MSLEAARPLGLHLAPKLEHVAAAAPGNRRLRAAVAAVYAAVDDHDAHDRHLSAPAGEDGSTYAARASALRNEWAAGRQNLPANETERRTWVARMHQIGVELAAADERARQHTAEKDIEALKTITSLLGRHPALLERPVSSEPVEDLWIWFRDHALGQLVAAAGDGESTGARQAAYAWAATFEQTVSGQNLGWSETAWSPAEFAAVTTAIDVSAIAGPATLAAVLSGISQVTFPTGDHAGQLTSSTLTALVLARTTAGRGPAWWSDPAATSTFAVLSDTLANNEPERAEEAWPLQLAAEAISGEPGWPTRVITSDTPSAASLENVLVTPGTGVDFDDGRVIGFVQRVDGDAETGVTWWPRQGRIMSVDTPDAATALRSVADVAGVGVVRPDWVSKFCPPVPVPGAGFGPVAVVDLERIDDVAATTGAEVLAVSGTLSARGVQVIVRIGPGSHLAIRPSPGLVILRDPKIKSEFRY